MIGNGDGRGPIKRDAALSGSATKILASIAFQDKPRVPYRGVSCLTLSHASLCSARCSLYLWNGWFASTLIDRLLPGADGVVYSNDALVASRYRAAPSADPSLYALPMRPNSRIVDVGHLSHSPNSSLLIYIGSSFAKQVTGSKIQSRISDCSKSRGSHLNTPPTRPYAQPYSENPFRLAPTFLFSFTQAVHTSRHRLQQWTTDTIRAKMTRVNSPFLPFKKSTARFMINSLTPSIRPDPSSRGSIARRSSKSSWSVLWRSVDLRWPTRSRG